MTAPIDLDVAVWSATERQWTRIMGLLGRKPGACPRAECKNSTAYEQGGLGLVLRCGCGWVGNLDMWTQQAKGWTHEMSRSYLGSLFASGLVRGEDAVPELDGVTFGRTYADLVEIIRGPAWSVVDGRKLRLNELGRRIMLGDKAATDADVSMVRERIQRRLARYSEKGELTFAADAVAEALHQVASERIYNPVRDYLGALRWDGTPRLDRVALDILGVEGELAQVLVRKWMLSAVARAMSPGEKVDTVLILSGEGGRRKSSFFSVLGGEWFSDTSIDPAGKDGLLACGRFWIIEFAELHSLLRGRDAATNKQFVSSATDTYRPPYGRIPVEVPRPSVFCGTTNESGFLTGDGGDRRYWPIEVEKRIDLDLLKAWRDQLWAEAMLAYSAGEKWWLGEDGERELESAQREFGASDPWDDPVSAWLASGSSEFTTSEALSVVDLDAAEATRGDQMRMGGILRRLGCRPTRQRRGSRVTRAWVRPAIRPDPT